MDSRDQSPSQRDLILTMRLSADILSNSEQRSNALGEREIVLRGLAIPAIEHLAATRDLFDTFDFADNRITRLENFPRLQRLSSLFLSGNAIESIDGKNLGKNIPNITNLVLTNNRISGLHEVVNIASGCKKLEYLTLIGNPVTSECLFDLFDRICFVPAPSKNSLGLAKRHEICYVVYILPHNF